MEVLFECVFCGCGEGDKFLETLVGIGDDGRVEAVVRALLDVFKLGLGLGT